MGRRTPRPGNDREAGANYAMSAGPNRSSWIAESGADFEDFSPSPEGGMRTRFRLAAQPVAPRSTAERDPHARQTPKAQPPGGLGRFDLRQDGGDGGSRTRVRNRVKRRLLRA